MTDPTPPSPFDPYAETAAGVAPSAPGLQSAPRSHLHGGRVGRYQILREIGEGGMGVVYEAQQDNPRRIVALKVVKAGLMSRDMLRRFEFEGQVLGRLQHPGIAQIYEAGMFDVGYGAQPFFAMEFIRGRPLTELVLEKGAPVRERLEILVQICDAVQHAHAKGVVHRDLKPGNVLVVDDPSTTATDHSGSTIALPGRVKILDFGVARAVDSDIAAATMRTDVGQLVGTLPYMSPEQVAGNSADVDARSDVYALGVMMYEMLAHRLPYDLQRKTVAQAARIISEDEPRPLSAVSRAMRGDLETIVAKALEKDRARRYQSAADLAADIRRYLRDEPIVARPASTFYVLSKFARRNKALVGGVIGVIVVLLAGVIVSSYGFATARMAQKDAEREARNARDAETQTSLEMKKTRAVNDFLVKELLGAANPSVAQGKEITVAMILEQAANRVGEAFKDQPELEGSIRNTIGETYVGLSRFNEAMVQNLAAYEAFRKSLGDENSLTLGAISNIASIENHLGLAQAAVDRLQAALPTMVRVLGEDHNVTLTARQLLATSLSDLARFDEAAPILLQVMESQKRVLGPEHDDTITSISNYAYLLSELGDFVRAESMYRQVYEIRLRTDGPAHPRTIASMQNLAVTLSDRNRFEEAEQLMRDSIESSRRVLGPDHQGTFNAEGNLAIFLLNLGKIDEGAAMMSEVCEGRLRVLGPDHPDTINGQAELVAILREQGRVDESIALGERVVAACARAFGPDHPDTFIAMQALGVAYYVNKDFENAQRVMKDVYEGRLRALGADHPDTISSEHNLGALMSRLNRLDEADSILADALERTLRINGDQHRQTHNTLAVLGNVREKQGRIDEALDLCRRSYEGRILGIGPTHPDTMVCRDDLVDLLMKLKRFDQAVLIALESYTLHKEADGADNEDTIASLRVLADVSEAAGDVTKAAEFRAMIPAEPASQPQIP